MIRVVSYFNKSNLTIWGLILLLMLASFTDVALSDRLQPAAGTAATVEEVELPIIMYHGVLEDKAKQGRYVISPALFESDLAYLKQQGYHTVTVADLLDYVDKGIPLPEKPIMLTFDEGYYNNYRYAYPLLQQYDMRAVIAPIVRWTAFYSDTPSEQDRPLYSHVTWAQISEMAQSGTVEFQNHSYDMHYTAPGKRKGTLKLAGETEEAYAAALREDVQKAQTLLIEQAGVTPTAFAYPFGAIEKGAEDILRELGFRATFTSESRINRLTRDADSLYGLGRYLRPLGSDSKTYFTGILK